MDGDTNDLTALMDALGLSHDRPVYYMATEAIPEDSPSILALRMGDYDLLLCRPDFEARLLRFSPTLPKWTPDLPHSGYAWWFEGSKESD